MISQRCLDLPRVGSPRNYSNPVHTVVLLSAEYRGTGKAIGAGLSCGKRPLRSCWREPQLRVGLAHLLTAVCPPAGGPSAAANGALPGLPCGLPHLQTTCAFIPQPGGLKTHMVFAG